MNVIKVDGVAQARSAAEIAEMVNEIAVDEVAKKITELVKNHAFPVGSLRHVNSILADCNDRYYALQQLWYLKNIIQAGIAKPINYVPTQ